MTDELSLTHEEARTRADLLDVHRYDVEFDLTGLVDGPDLVTTSAVRFTCRQPGAATFVDCLADVVEATLNGEPLPAAEGGRIALKDLRDENELVVRARQSKTDRAQGALRVVDDADQRVYMWTSFEPDDARRVFACFDQPDLKAVFGVRVLAPAGWTVTSNSGSPRIEDAGGARTWTFADTPPLSTYVLVVNAGPFHQVRSERGGYDLGLFARASLAAMLDRDAEELFEVTARGLAFFGDKFAMPFPQRTYDQVFLPGLGGAMENYGCVTWLDSVLFRQPPSYAEREARVVVLLHEMAHMWFGDIVTMRWWDDLWLNESFAEWACHWAASRCTEFTDAWAAMLAVDKQLAYAADAAPTSHPIRQPIPDVAAAEAAFDSITYPKGSAALKQLVAYVGEPAFLAGLGSYFKAHAWGNATLDGLIGHLEASSGRDLTSWVKGWLETAGTDRIDLVRSGADARLTITSPSGRGPLAHRLAVGVYDEAAKPGDVFRRRGLESVEIDSDTVELAGVGDAALLLVNDEDLTYASVRPDPDSLRLLLEEGGRLPSAVGRTLAVTTAWNLLYSGETSTGDYVSCAARVLANETSPSVVEPLLGRLVSAADGWARPDERDGLLEQVADLCLQLAGSPGHRVPAVRGLARTATTDAQLDALARMADRPDLQWGRLTRLAELGRFDRAESDALLEADPDPDAWASALIARAAKPSAEAKDEVWTAVFDERRVTPGHLAKMGRTFWRPQQTELLTPYAERFLELLPALGEGGMLWSLSMALYMYPQAGIGPDYPKRLDRAAGGEEVSPAVRQEIRERADRLTRMLAARARPR
ncbi:MAG TPA: aminopeptidase N [Nocardioidaceae bacterium]|nr:aminopeptidase N [Nocardioidaceae bacterium]